MMIRDPMRIRVKKGPNDIEVSWSMNWNELDGGPKAPEENKDDPDDVEAIVKLVELSLISNVSRIWGCGFM
jgi:hypothetical protein